MTIEMVHKVQGLYLSVTTTTSTTTKGMNSHDNDMRDIAMNGNHVPRVGQEDAISVVKLSKLRSICIK